MATHFFQRSFVLCLVVSVFKVSNDLHKYLLRHNLFKDCLESDVHHMTSQILSILIDFIPDHAFFVPFLGRFANLQTLITLEPETISRNNKRQSLRFLKEFHKGQ